MIYQNGKALTKEELKDGIPKSIKYPVKFKLTEKHKYVANINGKLEERYSTANIQSRYNQLVDGQLVDIVYATRKTGKEDNPTYTPDSILFQDGMFVCTGDDMLFFLLHNPNYVQNDTFDRVGEERLAGTGLFYLYDEKAIATERNTRIKKKAALTTRILEMNETQIRGLFTLENSQESNHLTLEEVQNYFLDLMNSSEQNYQHVLEICHNKPLSNELFIIRAFEQGIIKKDSDSPNYKSINYFDDTHILDIPTGSKKDALMKAHLLKWLETQPEGQDWLLRIKSEVKN